MADRTAIEWTDATWNPVTGCSIVSKGCTNCYAMKLAGTRLRNTPSRIGLTKMTNAGPVWTGEVRFNEEWLDQPIRWRRPRRIFVCAHGDLFAEGVPDEWIDRIFAVMALAPQHTFQVLTKRPERMRAWFAERWQGTPAMKIGGIEIPAGGETGRRGQVEQACEPLLAKLGLVDTTRDELWTEDGNCKAMQWAWPLPNVWLGVSIEDQPTADARVPLLLDTPAAVRFVSAEPLLGPIDLTRVGNVASVRNAFPGAVGREERGRPASGKGSISGVQIDAIGPPGSCITFFQTPDHMGGFTAISPREWPRLDWVIVGGESGPKARISRIEHARSLRDQCRAAGVPFFYKQHGEWIDADAWLDVIERGSAEIAVDGVRWVPTRPLNFDDAARLARLTGRPRIEHQSDGTTYIRVGKAAAGRLLDGRTWDEFPEAHP